MVTAVKSPAATYAERALSGDIVAGRLVRLACERHLRDLETGHERGLWFDPEAEERVIRFFSLLQLSDGSFAGKPFRLEPWQEFIQGSLFGWKVEDGSRRFRTAYCEIGKGNGKSPMAAGDGLYLLTADGEERAEVYAAAVDRDQAQVLFRDAVAMGRASEGLSSRLTYSGGPGKEWNIAYLETGSFFRPLSSEHTGGRGKSGPRPHGVLLDEVHEHPSSAMVDFMRAGTKGRRQALVGEFTNSGYDRRSVCYQHHEMSVRVLEGVIENDSWFAYVCGLDACDACRIEGQPSPKDDCEDCDDWRDENVWRKANPNLGVSISHRYLRELVDEAIQMPSKRNIVKRLNFCIWTSTNAQWISEATWSENDGELRDLAGRECYAGLVVGDSYDIAGFVLWFPDEDGGGDVLPFLFCPQERVAERPAKDMVPYDQWASEGHLTATEGNVTDYETIRAKLNELSTVYNIRQVSTKRWGAIQLQNQLQGDGFEVVQYSDGFAAMSDPSKVLEKMLVEKKIRHAGHPVLRWKASNIAIRTDPEQHIRPDKEGSADTIAGLEMLIIAIGAANAGPETGEAGVFFV